MKRKKRKSNLPFIFLFIIGLLILLYPQISDFYYRYESKIEMKEFETIRSQLSQQEIDSRMELARGYNSSLTNSVSDDPYDKKLQENGKKEYARMIEIKEKIGYVSVPKISENLPIYAGTSEEILQKGAGHLEGTSLPIGGESSHTVITAHSGLPTAKLFTNLNKLEIGDKFYLKNISETLAYEVDQIEVVEPHDFEKLLISEGKDYATLLTCTPYMVNTHRLLVRGHRVPYVPELDDDDIDSARNKILRRYYLYSFIMISLVLAIIVITFKKRRVSYEDTFSKNKG